MRRKLLLLAGVLAISTLCGCSMFKLELTASEHDKIAEYAAYALLSNAEDYNNKLLDKEEVDRILEERALEDKIKQEMENLNNQPTRPQQTVKPTEPDVSANPDDQKPDAIVPDDPEGVKGIGQILGLENVSVQYSGSELCKIYPNDSSELVVLKAKDNKQFAALSFVIQNTSAKQTECNILSRNIIYRLKLSNGDSYKAMLTLMDKDFATWNTPLAPESMNMAFLIFEVPDTLTEKDFAGAELSFKENGVTQSVTLK